MSEAASLHDQLAANELRAIYRLCGGIRIWNGVEQGGRVHASTRTGVGLNVDIVVDRRHGLPGREWLAVGWCAREAAIELLDGVAPGWTTLPRTVTGVSHIYITDALVEQLADLKQHPWEVSA